ncbi:MAG: zinc ribbon domain-containing protein [Promethearchaeota archaeon]|nr:MAG: zinc ribbon domain-containing protein [Candidatus Lokiarchaeota archaeon]
MQYKRNQYSEGFSICALIIAGAFLYWGIESFIPLDAWSWWGFISIGIGAAILASQIYAIANRSKLRNVVLAEFTQNPEATVEDVSRSTGISRKDINAIVLDLKASNQLIGKFNSETGQIKHMSIPEKEIISEERAKFCSNCGTPIKEAAQYCAYCGAQI